MVLGIGVSSYGNELSPAANDSAESINRSITSLNYDTRNENINFKMQNGTAYTSN